MDEKKYIKSIRKKANRPKSIKALILFGNFVAIIFLIFILFFLIDPIQTLPVNEFPEFTIAMAFVISIISSLGAIFYVFMYSYRLLKPKLDERMLIKYFDKLNRK